VIDDEDSLARGKAVGLDHERPLALALEVGLRRAGALEASPRAGRDAMAIEELLREDLRALEARARLAGAEDERPALAQPIGEAERERILGPDHDEVGTLLLRQAREPVDVGRAHGDVAAELLGPRVAGRAHDLLHERRGRDLPAQRVLASAGADD